MSEDGGSARKAKQGTGKRLNDKQRVEIIQISENSKISKRQLAENYGVSEAAIRKLLLKKDEFLKRYYDTPEELRDQRLRGRNLHTLFHDTDSAVATSASTSTSALRASTTAGSAVGSHASALFAASSNSQNNNSTTDTAHYRTLYPPDDPWKHGLHTLGTKLAPFLQRFVDARSNADTDDVASSSASSSLVPPIDWIGFARMLRDIRRGFHRFPELGYREVRTQAFIQRFCASTLGIPAANIHTVATTGLIVDVGYRNLVVNATSDRKSPVLAFRADMDALPIEEENDHLPYCSTATHALHHNSSRRRKKRKSSSATSTDTNETNDSPATTTTATAAVDVDHDELLDAPPTTAAAHMCGHDGHMVIVLGLCALVVRHAHLLPPDAFVRFLFQPAEEGPGGAEQMIADGALEAVDDVYGLHNYPFPLHSVHVRSGPVMAHEVEFSVDIYGVGGHGSLPQQCVDPILAGSAVVQALQSIVSRSLSPTDTAVVSVTQFRGGDTNNVIPAHVVLGGTIRVFDLDVADVIKARMERIVHSTCAALGATAQVHFSDGYAPVINPVDETRLVQQVAAANGFVVSEDGLPLMAAEDFAYYLQARKGCFAFLGTKDEHDSDASRALHSTQYDFNDKALPLGIRLFVGILQTRLQCELYALDDMQTFQQAMERISGGGLLVG